MGVTLYEQSLRNYLALTIIIAGVQVLGSE